MPTTIIFIRTALTSLCIFQQHKFAIGLWAFAHLKKPARYVMRYRPTHFLFSLLPWRTTSDLLAGLGFFLRILVVSALFVRIYVDSGKHLFTIWPVLRQTHNFHGPSGSRLAGGNRRTEVNRLTNPTPILFLRAVKTHPFGNFFWRNYFLIFLHLHTFLFNVFTLRNAFLGTLYCTTFIRLSNALFPSVAGLIF